MHLRSVQSSQVQLHPHPHKNHPNQKKKTQPPTLEQTPDANYWWFNISWYEDFTEPDLITSKAVHFFH